MSKQTLLSLLLGYGELNFIKGCVVVGFGPDHKGHRTSFWEVFYCEEKNNAVTLPLSMYSSEMRFMAISSRGQGHWVFIPATGVRLPVSSPYGQDIGGTYA